MGILGLFVIVIGDPDSQNIALTYTGCFVIFLCTHNMSGVHQCKWLPEQKNCSNGNSVQNILYLSEYCIVLNNPGVI